MNRANGTNGTDTTDAKANASGLAFGLGRSKSCEKWPENHEKGRKFGLARFSSVYRKGTNTTFRAFMEMLQNRWMGTSGEKRQLSVSVGQSVALCRLKPLKKGRNVAYCRLMSDKKAMVELVSGRLFKAA